MTGGARGGAAAPPVADLAGGRRLVAGGLAAAALGLALLVVGAAVDRAQAAHSYLAAYATVVGVALGALLFLMIHHAAAATWPVVLRRLPEAVAATLPLLALLFVPIALSLADLYPWARPEAAHEPRLARLRPWLGGPLFVARAAGYLALWSALALALRRRSLRQDAPGASGSARALCAAGLPAVALTLTFAAFDWLMSLRPPWVSTLFGVYYFAGGFVAALALVVLLAYAAERAGPLAGLITPRHYHALGRLLLAFVAFWAYCAFSQLFILWIADRPDEIAWLLPRFRGSWARVGIALGAGHFALPFSALLSRRLKERPRALALVSAWLLAMHALDVHWLVLPALHRDAFRPHWLDAAALLFVGGAALAWGAASARGHAVAPRHDPALAASCAYRGPP